MYGIVIIIKNNNRIIILWKKVYDDKISISEIFECFWNFRDKILFFPPTLLSIFQNLSYNIFSTGSTGIGRFPGYPSPWILFQIGTGTETSGRLKGCFNRGSLQILAATTAERFSREEIVKRPKETVASLSFSLWNNANKASPYEASTYETIGGGRQTSFADRDCLDKEREREEWKEGDVRRYL